MKIGKIISIEYDKFRVKLFHTTRNSAINIEGRVYYFGNIGSYLKVMNSLGEYVLCEVVSIVDRIEDENKIYGEFNLDSSREIIIKPIGTLKTDGFSMGIGVFPSLYTDVEIVTDTDFGKILRYEEKGGNQIHSSIDIGESKSLISYNIKIDIDKLFNIHTAVLGNTGSGKSTTIAHILQEIYRKKNNSALGAKTIIFDANGEYSKAFSGAANIESGITPIFYKPNINRDDHIQNSFYLPYYLMNLDEWLSFLMASERTQKPFWDRVLQECYKFYKILNAEEIGMLGKFVNYIKWKLCGMLRNITSRAESDTSKMTAAKGVIIKIKSICSTIKEKRNPNNNAEKEIFADLENFLTICDKLCIIYYGSNNNSLLDALDKFVDTGDSSKKYVKIKRITENGTQRYIVELEANRNGESFRQIDEVSAQKINEDKLKSGEYYDYKFLMTSVEIVLLEEEARGNLRIREFVSTLMSRLDFFMHNDECEFMRIGRQEYKDATDYLDKVLGISASLDDRQKQLITIDASEVSADTLELMTTVISRMIFDYRKKKKGSERQKCPIHLILDEAHRYIHKDADYFMHENIFEKIAREGRKYSLYLIVSSQRPSELSQTVLSQCGNYIVHRIQNEVDMKYIYSVLPYFSQDYITKIKQAVPGEALIFGNCVPMPLMVKIKQAEPTPNSENCEISKEWFIPDDTNEDPKANNY